MTRLAHPATRLGRRDPFADFDTLVRRAFGPWPTFAAAEPVGGPVGFAPAVSHRDGDDAVIRLDLPGVDLDQLAIELQGPRLVVSGERTEANGDEGAAGQIREVRHGSFRRVFQVGAHVTADDIIATYDAGVLTVRVHGAYAEATGQRIEIRNGEVNALPSVEGPTD